MDELTRDEARRLAELAGIQLPHERVSALAAGLQMTRGVAEALAWLEYGEAAPACQFRPPRRESQ